MVKSWLYKSWLYKPWLTYYFFHSHSLIVSFPTWIWFDTLGFDPGRLLVVLALAACAALGLWQADVGDSGRLML
jgi:hypothetical protein